METSKKVRGMRGANTNLDCPFCGEYFERAIETITITVKYLDENGKKFKGLGNEKLRIHRKCWDNTDKKDSFNSPIMVQNSKLVMLQFPAACARAWRYKPKSNGHRLIRYI